MPEHRLYRVIAAVNTASGHCDGYTAGDPLAVVTSHAGSRSPLVFAISAESQQDVLEEMWRLGNRARDDRQGRYWPSDVRPLSTGDVLLVYPPQHPHGAAQAFAVAPAGFDPITTVPRSAWVALEGSPATSRPAPPAETPVDARRVHRALAGGAVSRAGRSPAELADTAYEAIRALNHATFPGQVELTSQHDLYSVLGNLAALLRITPQALRQTSDWLAREQQGGRVGVDGACPGSPASTVAAVLTALLAAADAVARAARQVDRAQQAAAHLTTEQTNHIGI